MIEQQAVRSPEEEGDYMAFEQLVAEAAIKKEKEKESKKKGKEKKDKDKPSGPGEGSSSSSSSKPAAEAGTADAPPVSKASM